MERKKKTRITVLIGYPYSKSRKQRWKESPHSSWVNPRELPSSSLSSPSLRLKIFCQLHLVVVLFFVSSSKFGFIFVLLFPFLFLFPSSSSLLLGHFLPPLPLPFLFYFFFQLLIFLFSRTFFPLKSFLSLFFFFFPPFLLSSSLQQTNR
jgi:hypothetical protein